MGVKWCIQDHLEQIQLHLVIVEADQLCWHLVLPPAQLWAAEPLSRAVPEPILSRTLLSRLRAAQERLEPFF